MTCGGTTLGYDSTPSWNSEITPASVIRIAITHAKIGWPMKNLDMIGPPQCLSGVPDALSSGFGFGASFAGPFGVGAVVVAAPCVPAAFGAAPGAGGCHGVPFAGWPG